MIGTVLGKAIIFVENIFKYNASSFPGRVVLKLFPKYLTKLKYPDLVIIVTGSSGKGSTTKYIADTLRKNNMKVVHNISGSNLLDGVTGDDVIKKGISEKDQYGNKISGRSNYFPPWRCG